MTHKVGYLIVKAKVTAATPPNNGLQPTRVPLRSTRAADANRYANAWET